VESFFEKREGKSQQSIQHAMFPEGKKESRLKGEEGRKHNQSQTQRLGARGRGDIGTRMKVDEGGIYNSFAAAEVVSFFMEGGLGGWKSGEG